ncbi:cytochrome c oxidase subunit II [Deinococcus radiophilus]|uniref:Cytochrome C oxidase subunit II n=2 Tax=Deinococcus radiophilus TaxID=32062 RepID=A0A3S0KAB2_9DEIO|nr:cytochrome c oxidase subunit II [Deinococcus radiophilus]RTR26223.1 cytochrome C oxidase subunit II [Deinococcus radiophilus]UFA50326.1 cytochrome c oxidase subunit II [Deinococcus radiophilus]
MTRPLRTAPRLEHHSLSIYENIWLVIGLLIQLVLFVGVMASLVSGTSPLTQDNTAGHNHLAGVTNGRVDPANLQATAFGKPGLYLQDDGSYQAIVVAKAFAFDPPFLRVPAGRDVTFHVTAQDVVHGYYVHGTNINVDLMPGQVASFKSSFDTPGEYNVICYEYCGIGHHNMINKIIVEPAGTDVPTVNAPATTAQTATQETAP